MEPKKKELAEDQQKKMEQLALLQENQVFKDLQAQLTQLLRTKRREQRSALQKSDSMYVFRLEAEISGIEQFFKMYDGQLEMLDKLSEGLPTVLKY